MAYETSNPIKKIAQMGDANSLWYYNDADASGGQNNANYWLAEYKNLKVGDIILASSAAAGSNVVSTYVVRTSTSSSVTVA
jgi:hypothetical protein